MTRANKVNFYNCKCVITVEDSQEAPQPQVY